MTSHELVFRPKSTNIFSSSFDFGYVCVSVCVCVRARAVSSDGDRQELMPARFGFQSVWNMTTYPFANKHQRFGELVVSNFTFSTTQSVHIKDWFKPSSPSNFTLSYI
jgi:hypothetical protein